MDARPRSTSDSVLQDALIEIREMNKVNSETLLRNKCSCCYRGDCDCEKRIGQLYTCLNGHVHNEADRPKGVRFGDVPIKAPCPLYSHNTNRDTSATNDDDLIVFNGFSNKGQAFRNTQWMKRRSKTACKVWTCIFAVVITGLLVTLVIFTIMIKKQNANMSQDGLSPPLVGPGGPDPGESVYRLDDESFFVGAHHNGQYSCQIIYSDSVTSA